MVAVCFVSSTDNINVAPIGVPVCYGRGYDCIVSQFGENDSYLTKKFGKSVKGLIKKIKNGSN